MSCWVAARNIGCAASGWLVHAGFNNLDDVRTRGVIETARAVRAAGHPVTFNLVLALQGAVMNCDWRRVPPEIADDLRTRWERRSI